MEIGTFMEGCSVPHSLSNFIREYGVHSHLEDPGRPLKSRFIFHNLVGEIFSRVGEFLCIVDRISGGE